MPLLATIRLLLLKDVRAMRAPLVLIALMLAAMMFVATPASSLGDAAHPVSYILLVFFYGVTAVFIVQLILLDPTAREFRFLLTRPVSGAAIGLSKALFVGLVLFLPAFATMEIIIARNDIPLSLTDHLLLAAEYVVGWGFWSGWLALLAAFLKRMPAVFLFVVGFGLSALVGAILWVHYVDSRGIGMFLRNSGAPLGLRTWLREVIVLGSLLFALGRRYAARDFARPWLIVAAGVALSFVPVFMPLPARTGLENGDESKDSKWTPEQLSRIQLEKTTFHSGWVPGGENLPVLTILSMEMRVVGVEAPYFAEAVHCTSTVTLRSGQALHPVQGGSTSHFTVPQQLAAWTAHLPDSRPELPPVMVQLMSCVARDIPPGEDGRGATVKGEITLDIRRGFIAHTIPLKEGASWSSPGQHYEVISFKVSNDRPEWRVEASQVPLLLREYDRRNLAEPLMVDRATGTILQGYPISSQGILNLGVFITRTFYKDMADVERATVQDALRSSRRKPGGPPDDPPPWHWPADVDLIFFDSESCGQVTVPFELHDVDLNPH